MMAQDKGLSMFGNRLAFANFFGIAFENGLDAKLESGIMKVTIDGRELAGDVVAMTWTIDGVEVNSAGCCSADMLRKFIKEEI